MGDIFSEAREACREGELIGQPWVAWDGRDETHPRERIGAVKYRSGEVRYRTPGTRMADWAHLPDHPDQIVAYKILKQGAEPMTADDILDALIAVSHDKIWAIELPFRGSSTRIDFWTLAPVKSKGFRTVAYEIKVSKADFNRDSEAKQKGALEFSDRFFYVTPPGLLDRANVPDWAGLIEWHGAYPKQGFKVIKKPPIRDKSDPDWGVIVDVIRNSGQCRRDISLLAGELAFYKSQHERQKNVDAVKNGRQTSKFLQSYRPLPAVSNFS